jgi:hypothetical protein
VSRAAAPAMDGEVESEKVVERSVVVGRTSESIEYCRTPPTIEDPSPDADSPHGIILDGMLFSYHR